MRIVPANIRDNRAPSLFRVVFEAIRQLLASPDKEWRSIGFNLKEAGPIYRVRRRRGTG